MALSKESHHVTTLGAVGAAPRWPQLPRPPAGLRSLRGQVHRVPQQAHRQGDGVGEGVRRKRGRGRALYPSSPTEVTEHEGD